MTQMTMVALYGEKSGDFAELITRCQGLVRSVLGDGFQPYDLSQIHATIFGLERKSSSALYNANFSRYRGLDLVMNLEGILCTCRTGSRSSPVLERSATFATRDTPRAGVGRSLPRRHSSRVVHPTMVLGADPDLTASALMENLRQLTGSHPDSAPGDKPQL
jgi:hypothetical protein